MNKWIFLLLFPLVALGQPVPPPATQTEVNAGLNKFKYVTPFTLQGWTVGGATGAVTVAQLNSSSNAIIAILVANDTTTSNGVVALELTRNAAVSNALVTLLVANDTTTSNGLVTLETTRNAAVSNAVVTLLVANDTITSNGAVAFSMQASNDLYAIETIRNAAVSNNLVTLLVANDTTTSNGIVALEVIQNTAVSNSVIAYMLGVAVTNADTRTTWINNLNVGNNFRVTNTATFYGLVGFNALAQAGAGLSVVGGLASDTLAVTAGGTIQGGGSFAGIFTLFDGFDPTSTNLIHSLTSDTSPAIGDFIMTEDVSTGLLKKVSIGNLPTGSGEVNYVGDAGITNSTKTSLSHSKQGVTNFLKTIEAGYGLIRTNQGTNLNFAIDPTAIAAPGGSGAIQFAQGTSFRGTNDPSTQQFGYNATNANVIINKTGVGELHIFANRLVEISTTPLLFGVAGNTNWQISNLADFSPTTTDVYDFGTSALRVRTNWLRFGDFSSGLALRDPATVNSGRGTIFAHPSDWKVTNQFNFSLTNVQAGQLIKVSSASISGGLATIVLTNDFTTVQQGSGMFLRTTNMWFDGGVSSLYSNTFTSTSGGLTNIVATNILDGQSVHLWFWASNGVTVNFPQFVDSDYPDGAVISANSNCWTHVIIDRRNTTTNISMFTAGLTLQAGNFTEAVTNYATRTITYQNTTRTTNYATGALTINCATDVRASITNAVASNYAITLATPVLGTAGSLSLVSDNVTARTLAILCPSSTITWMSTNYTANATNILTTVNKRSTFSWRNQLATDGSTTNTSVWVVNQF